jgi:hypothetical protein
MTRVCSNRAFKRFLFFIKKITSAKAAFSHYGVWNKGLTQSCIVSGVKDVHNLYLKFTGSSGLLLNFDGWIFYFKKNKVTFMPKNLCRLRIGLI